MMYDVSDDVWETISKTLKRPVAECELQLKQMLLHRCLTMCCNSLTSQSKAVVSAAKEAFVTLIISMNDKVLPNTPLPSPNPTSLTGIPNSFRTASTTPPFAVPSSLVKTTPVTGATLANPCACERAFCPIVASNTSNVSCGASGSFSQKLAEQVAFN